jgi:DNA polymerase-4
MLFDPIATSYDSPEAAACFIKDSVREKFGFTVNVGISDRKVLAKMASDFEKPDKVHTLYANEIQQKMWRLPVGELFMCGKSASEKLNHMGISTIGDLARTDKALVETWLKSHGGMLWEFANGIDNGTVNPLQERAKGVGNSTTVAQDISSSPEAYKILRQLSESVARRLKKQHMRAGSVCVEIKYASFVSNSHQKPLLSATDDAELLYREACSLFDELWTGEPVRLLGVRTTKLEDADEPQQINLFEFQEQMVQEDKQKKLDAALANIRTRYGEDAIQKGL